MSTLLLLLTGPLQAWGDSSRFAQRTTNREPTKSGVIGLVAAAQGRRRTDSLEDLLTLRFGVRVDAPGEIMRDFQTARQTDGKSLPLTYRYYLSDATFVSGLEGPEKLLTALDGHLRSPEFPLYLGRRSCPPSRPVALGVRETSLEEALRAERWRASEVQQQRIRARQVKLRMVLDAEPGTDGITQRDVPLSFDPEHRQYAWRAVADAEPGTVTKRHGRDDYHDPMAELGG